ncbi:hypothetical protein BCR37DRAFT_82906 [Protomyces lactucae-debilis]|uniref:F-box domain-containing protein n=1 Tax=Protomyces lactucae-debilis TaxID=2754530 RepID=A0A1Y2F810_PROLT|nr:uncharacterized protein BCR37DRAFT_82906 [Protomyces lactucae-debilis]ORY79989.1 hypothetical protein BCR37DRAFT_82906 [Protomyces lactucae-debilis]
MARNRTRKRSLQTLPAATLNRIFSYLDPHSAAAAEHTSKCFRAVFQSNDTPYKTIRIRLSGIETLPDGWTEKQFLHFMLPSRTWSGSEACLECTAPSKPFAFIKLHCCAACAARTALSYDQALAHLLQLQPNMAEADACDLLELTPGMLNPTMKRWRLDRCLFARDALNCIYERFRASGLSIMEFAKMQPPSLLQTALIQRIDKCYEYRVMLDATKHDLSEGATMARKRQLTQLFDQKKLPESLRPYLGKMAADYHSHRDFCEDEMAASDHDLRDYCKDELEDLAPNMKQHLELIKQREDGLAITTKLEQHLLGWIHVQEDTREAPCPSW